MSYLVPENVSRKIDCLGRITFPKGMRNRLNLNEGVELEIFTANIDDRNCICLATPIDENSQIENAIEVLLEHNKITEEEAEKILKKENENK